MLCVKNIEKRKDKRRFRMLNSDNSLAMNALKNGKVLSNDGFWSSVKIKLHQDIFGNQLN